MDWFAQIAGSLSGLPWWAVLTVVVLSVSLTKGTDALLRFMGFGLEREKYRASEKHRDKDALVDALNKRIDKLETFLADVQRESREERIAAAKRLAEEQKAHANCQIEVTSLRGDIRVMQEQIKAIQRHEQVNKEQAHEWRQEMAKKIDTKADTTPG